MSSRRRRGLGCVVALWIAACGGASIAQADRRIVGGVDAPSAWPAVASVRLTEAKGASVCGGTLISASWVLTAAHCFDHEPVATRVVLGGRTLADPAGSAFPAAGVTVYEGYDHAAAPRGDLALIRLRDASTAAPQLLVGEGEEGLSAPGSLATILGWGVVQEGAAISLLRPLQQAQVPVVSDEDCRAAYGSQYEAASMLCAGRPEGGVDTCYGDSGGPLLVGPSPKATRLAGVTSWGDGCARPGRPGVYVRLQSPVLQKWVRDRVALDGFSVLPPLAAKGEPVRLTSTASSPGTGRPITALAWDLDGDGSFDDATGRSVTTVFESEGEPAVGLRVTRGQGEVTVARSTVVVRSAPAAPSPPQAVAPAAASPQAPAPAPAPVPAAVNTPAPLPPARPAAAHVAPAVRPGASPPAALRQRASLRVVVVPAGRRPRARTYTLRCGPVSGSWPARVSACARLLAPAAAAPLLGPFPPARGHLLPALRVTGAVDGRRVSLRVSRSGSAAGRARFKLVRRILGAAATDRALRVAARR